MRYLIALLVGLALGLSAGLLYAWVISPVEFTDISPAALVPAEREEYTILTARAYAANGDLQRAEARLRLLGETDPARAVTALAQRAAADGRPSETVAALSALALALGVGPGEAPALSQVTPVIAGETPAGPEATESLPTPGITRAAPTPSATPVFEYELAEVEQVCDPALDPPQIQALVQTADGQPLPGVEVLVRWEDGDDRFFTGFKPEFGLDFADFSMTPGATYSVALAARSQPAEGLTAEPCAGADGGSYPGSWRVTFRRLP